MGKALRFLVDASVGTEFEVCFEKEGPQTFYFHIRSTSVGAIDDEDLISVKRWAADFYIPKKHGNPEKLLGHMTDRPLGTVITPQDIARETYGLDDPVRGDINRIVTHMSQVVLRSERSWGDKLARAEKAAEISGESVTEAKMRRAREDFTIRRIRNGKGGSMTAGYRLMNRYEAMEQWIAGIALPGYLLEKILWKMLEYPLGTEFTTKQIAELLVSDGVQVTPHRVVDALMKRGGIVKKTAETEFEVEAERRATGQHAREYHFSIRP